MLRHHVASHLLITVGLACLLASCGDKEPIRLSSPAPAAFRQEAPPQLNPQVVIDDDEEGYRQHQRNKDEWGQRGWDALNRVCLWFQDQGVEGLPCVPDPLKVP